MSEWYVLGGTPCAGKTTIAHIIAQEHGWRIYHLDRHIESFLQRATPDKHPALTAYRDMGIAGFLAQEPAAQLAQIQAMSAEQFDFIIAELQTLPTDAPILLEGAHLRLEDVVTHIDPARTIWLVPDESFLLDVYPNRAQWVLDALNHHFDEERRVAIFDAWMTRDRLFAEWAAAAAHQQGIRVITVDGRATLLENAAQVMQHFGLITP